MFKFSNNISVIMYQVTYAIAAIFQIEYPIKKDLLQCQILHIYKLNKNYNKKD